jgi:uncharacterized protein YcnI
MPTDALRRRKSRVAALVTLGLMMFPALAGAHARVSPAVSLAKQLQYYTLAVPTEKSGVSTTQVVVTFPSGFGVDSFAPPPGWRMQVAQSGSGDSATITRATFTGGRTPTGQDSVFGFLAQPQSSGTYRFTVTQTYSDGSIVEWNGPESAEAPAPTIQAVDSLGGGGTSAITYVALVVGILGLVAGGMALASGAGGRGGRPLA